jgi:curved DNA-binding protein CbpA
VPPCLIALAAVGAAYACLSDGNERADYDRYGADGPQMRQRRGGGGGGGYHAHGDIDPEDIFNMFFGMQPQRRQQGRTYVYQQGQQRQRQQQQHQGGGGGGNYAQLVQLMPLLLLFLFSFLGNQAGRNDLPFRLQRTPPEYTFRRETASTGTPYYVKGDFEKLFGNRNKVSSSCSSCVCVLAFPAVSLRGASACSLVTAWCVLRLRSYSRWRKRSISIT